MEQYNQAVFRATAAWLGDPSVIIVMDWVGSLLMIGTVWGWLYGKLDVPLLRYENRYRNRREAYRRLWIRRGAKGAYDKAVEHWARHGIQLQGLPLAEQLKLTASVLRERQRLVRTGQATPEQVAEWRYLSSLEKTNVRASLILLPGSLMADASWMSLAALRSVTESVLTGRTAKVLFVLGFLMWNVSKASSLWL